MGAVRGAVAVAGAVLVAGCTAGTVGSPATDDDPPASPAGTAVAAAPGGGPAGGRDTGPEQFRTRLPLPLCGEVTLGRGAQLTPADVRCLAAAQATSTGGELVVENLTMEGDPVVYYYRSIPGRPGLEVFVDSSRDAFGSMAWARYDCPGARAAPTLPDGDCRQPPLR